MKVLGRAVPIRLDEKVIVVTGAGSPAAGDPEVLGIGAAIAMFSCAAGASVVVVDRDGEAAARTVRAIEQQIGPLALGRVVIAVADVGDDDAGAAVVASAHSAFGPVTTLVNNVGIAGPPGTAADVDLTAWDAAFAVNVTSMVRMVRAVLPDMTASGAGSIVNISSLAGLRGGHHGLSYPAAKSTVVGMTTTMAAHHGHAGVRVNAVVPGTVYTPMVAHRGLTGEARARRSASTMLGTEGTAWDVAGAVAFLASDASRWITAAAIPVDAGLGMLVPGLGVARDVG